MAAPSSTLFTLTLLNPLYDNPLYRASVSNNLKITKMKRISIVLQKTTTKNRLSSWDVCLIKTPHTQIPPTNKWHWNKQWVIVISTVLPKPCWWQFGQKDHFIIVSPCKEGREIFRKNKVGATQKLLKMRMYITIILLVRPSSRSSGLHCSASTHWTKLSSAYVYNWYLSCCEWVLNSATGTETRSRCCCQASPIVTYAPNVYSAWNVCFLYILTNGKLNSPQFHRLWGKFHLLAVKICLRKTKNRSSFCVSVSAWTDSWPQEASGDETSWFCSIEKTFGRLQKRTFCHLLHYFKNTSSNKPESNSLKIQSPQFAQWHKTRISATDPGRVARHCGDAGLFPEHGRMTEPRITSRTQERTGSLWTNLPATVMWLDRYDWRAVAMEILLRLNLCFSTLALDKEDGCRDQRRAMKEENFNEMRQSVRIFFWSAQISVWVIPSVKKRAAGSLAGSGRCYTAWGNVSCLFKCWSPKGWKSVLV